MTLVRSTRRIINQLLWFIMQACTCNPQCTMLVCFRLITVPYACVCTVPLPVLRTCHTVVLDLLLALISCPKKDITLWENSMIISPLISGSQHVNQSSMMFQCSLKQWGPLLESFLPMVLLLFRYFLNSL